MPSGIGKSTGNAANVLGVLPSTILVMIFSLAGLLPVLGLRSPRKEDTSQASARLCHKDKLRSVTRQTIVTVK